jgi:colanic acid/amylovoran biosynthesis protein
MKIVLTGVETNNKGAELMLYAILQEVERTFPDAEVYISPNAISQGLNYLQTRVKLCYWPFEQFVMRMHLHRIFRIMHIPNKILLDTYAVKADYFLDGSGFCFSDQCKLWGKKPEWWEKLLKRQYNYGAKIVFLPQAFGPVEMNLTKEALKVLNRYATMIMPREKVSYNYLDKSGLIDMNKVKVFTDFTSLVEGVFPKKYEQLRNGICIIPNIRMLDKGGFTFDKYKQMLASIVKKGKQSGHVVYLLNHEGEEDKRLAMRLKAELQDDIEVVTGLNALEVKGLIASAYALISSRFHGVASALNCCVPCLATSWSHKYQELFNDYGLDDRLLPLNDFDKAMAMVDELFSEENNRELRELLAQRVPLIQAETKRMWQQVWKKG